MLNVSTKIKQTASAATSFILMLSLLIVTLTVAGPQRVAAQTTRDTKSKSKPTPTPTPKRTSKTPTDGVDHAAPCPESTPDCNTGGPGDGGGTPNPTPTPSPASVLVNSAADPGDGICDTVECTLREAIAAVEPGGTINFDTAGVFATPRTISLTNGVLEIDKDLTIVGTGVDNLTVERSQLAANFRVFAVFTPVTVVISDLSINGGRAVEQTTQGLAGGGILNYNGNLTLQNCRLSQNSAGAGAAIANVDGTLLIEGSSIAGNTSGDLGGGVFNLGGTVTIANSSIFNNVGIRGAGIANYTNGAMTIRNTTVAHNRGNVAFTNDLDPDAIGGGILNQDSAGMTIRNSTVYGNVAMFGGGGIRTLNASLDLDSSIVAKNTAVTTPDIYGEISAGDYNLINSAIGFTFSNDDQFNIVGVDPELADLDFYGGLNPILPPGCSSPAIDKGRNIDSLLTDQRGEGFARTFDAASVDSAPGGDGTDIGAVESSGLIGIDDAYSVDENGALTIINPNLYVTANDSYPGCGSATPVLVDPPSHAYHFNFSNGFSYSPNYNFNGTDSFTYKLVSGSAESEVVTVTISVNGENDAPSAADDRYSTAANTILNVPAAGVMSNDSDPEVDELSAMTVLAPLHAASFNLNPDGSFSYLPDSGFSGIDSFTYKVSDGSLDSNIAVVAIRVGANNAPIANPDVYSMAEDAEINIGAPGVLANDSDSDPGDTITAVLTAGPANAAAFTLNSDGSFHYAPAPNFNGNDSFSYKARDTDAAESPIVTVTINVDPVNDAPVATNDSYLTSGGSTLTVAVPGVLGNDTDVDGDSLTAVLVDGPGHGTVVFNADGSFEYAPGPTFDGHDEFTYKVSDGTLESSLATVSVGSPLTVNVIADDNDGACEPLTSGDCTLREAITAVSPGGTITFDTAGVFATPQIISLTLGELAIAGSLTINGPGADQLSVSGGGLSRVFLVETGVDAAIDGITITGGTPGIRNQGELALTNSVVSQNRLRSGIDNSGVLTMTGSTVSGNSALSQGGGIINVNGLTLINSTVSGNSTGGIGGGIYAPNGTVTLINSTVSGNSAQMFAGGIFYDLGTLTFKNSIIANNSGGDCFSNLTGTVDASYSLVGDGSCQILAGGVGNQAGNPMLGPLDDNGGPTKTHALLPGSPAIDTGSSFLVPAGVTTDQRGGGFARIVGSSVDMGAFEVQPEGNSAPTANNDSYSTNEDTLLSGSSVLANDSDDENDTLSAVLISQAASGTVSLNPDGTFTYTPNSNFNGTDSFTYTASDGSSDSNIASVSITVDPVNDAPVANDDSYSTDEDTPLSGGSVLNNDADAEGDDLTAVLVVEPQHGSVMVNEDGSFSYTPAAAFHGTDSFTYKANDGSMDSNVATVLITVDSVNDAPVAVNDSYSTDEDTPLAGNVLANDSDVDGDTLTAAIVAGPAHGSVTLNADGSFTYTPAADFNGSDSFTYTASDGSSDSNVATVTITVDPVNDAPVTEPESYGTDEDTSVSGTSVLANDSDVDNDTLTAVLVVYPSNSREFVLNEDGTFSYTPAANFTGTDSFTYIATDGSLDSNLETVAINVYAVNDAPVANDDSYSTDEDTPLAVNVLANDSDVDGDDLNAVLVSGPAQGNVTVNADGSFSYTPAANFSGPVSFTYMASDGSLNSNAATVSIIVNAVNDAPVVSATPASQSVQYSDAISAVTFTASDVDSPISTSTQFNVDGGSFSTGVPNGLTIGTFTSGAATLSGVADVAAGVYIIRFTASDGVLSVSADHVLTVTKEHTDTEYTGDDYALTAGPAVDTANVRLAAQLTQQADGQDGEITKAKVSFLLFKNGNAGSTPDLIVSGVPVDDLGAALTFANLPVDTWTVMVKIDADNRYWEASQVGTGLIVIVQPTNELRTSGGGWVADPESVNNKGNFGFNVANQKKGVRGSSVYLYRGVDGYNYLVKSTSWNSGGIGFRRDAGQISLASFSGKCVVQKIDPATGDVVESFGNYSFTVDVRDGDLFNPRQPDKYAITILDGSGHVWRQVGAPNSPVVIGGGNVTVKGK